MQQSQGREAIVGAETDIARVVRNVMAVARRWITEKDQLHQEKDPIESNDMDKPNGRVARAYE